VPFRGLSGQRRFRWDAAKPDRMVALEYQGIGRGHQWHVQQATDHEKLTEGQLCGGTVIACDAQSANSGRCVEWIEAALQEGA
jgi:hypothetical protein